MIADNLFAPTLAAWVICGIVLTPAVWRLIGMRWRSLDPIWGVVFLLAINRIFYVLQIDLTIARGSAIVLALGMAYMSFWYQRHDT